MPEDHIAAAHIPGPGIDIQTPEEKVSWADNRLKELAPRFIQEIEHQLHYGSEKARREIALNGLDRIGLKEQQKGNAVAPVIVIKMVGALPWGAKQKLIKDGAVTEAELVEVTNAEE